MENLQKAIDATKEKNPTGFKEVVSAELASRLYAAINTKKESISKTVTAGSEENSSEQSEPEPAVSEANMVAPSAPVSGGKVGIPGSERGNAGVGEVPDPLEDELKDEVENAFSLKGDTSKLTAKDDDISLDPNFEKEFYMKEMDYKGHKVVLKQIGLGLSKPVRVYVDDKRWEFFPGPEAAIKSARSYVDSLDGKVESVENSSPTITERVEMDARTRLFKTTVNRLEQARKLRETKQNRLKENNNEKFNGLYDDGSGRGAMIPKPLDLSSPEEIAKTLTRQIQQKEVKESSITSKEIMDAINMKAGKYVMGEEELTDKQKSYRKFFAGALKKHGVSSPTELTGDKKKQFFSYVKANWKG